MPVCAAGSHLGTQSSITLTSLPRALKRRDGNWSSLVMERVFFSGLSSHLTQLSKFLKLQHDQPGHRAGGRAGVTVQLFNSILQSQHTSQVPKTQPSVTQYVFWKLQNNRESLHFTGFPLPGEGVSPMWRNPLFTGHPRGKLANTHSLTRPTDNFGINGSMYRKTQPNK